MNPTSLASALAEAHGHHLPTPGGGQLRLHPMEPGDAPGPMLAEADLV
jgi:hypothetical protein